MPSSLSPKIERMNGRQIIKAVKPTNNNQQSPVEPVDQRIRSLRYMAGDLLCNLVCLKSFGAIVWYKKIPARFGSNGSVSLCIGMGSTIKLLACFRCTTDDS